MKERKLVDIYLFDDPLKTSFQYGLHTVVYDDRYLLEMMNTNTLYLYTDAQVSMNPKLAYVGRNFNSNLFEQDKIIFWDIISNLYQGFYSILDEKINDGQMKIMKGWLHLFKWFYLNKTSAEFIYEKDKIK